MTPWAERMNQRQAAGLCRLCGKPQAPGRALCGRHLESERARRRAAYYERKRKRLCVEQGCTRPAVRGHVRCNACYAANTVYNREWMRAKRKREKGAAA